jgi:hypothetical protein
MSTGGIKLVSETVILWRTEARSIEGKLFLFSMTSGPTGVMGDSALVLKTEWYCGNTLPESLKLFARRAHSSLEKRDGNSKEMGKPQPLGATPPLMCTMTKALALRQ